MKNSPRALFLVVFAALSVAGNFTRANEDVYVYPGQAYAVREGVNYYLLDGPVQDFSNLDPPPEVIYMNRGENKNSLIAGRTYVMLWADQRQEADGPVIDNDSSRLTDEQLDTLLEPIALYPDPLLAEVLPACGYLADVQQANTWIGNNSDPSDSDIEEQGWEPSVKALVHYPTVIQMMSENGDWTETLGAAFTTQQADVMASIQRLRQKAIEQESLQNTDQQQVLVDADSVEILPTDPEDIYVPQYDPAVVYVQQAPVVFRWHHRVGPWLANGCDWQRHWLVEGQGWHPGWDHEAGQGWRPKDVTIMNTIRINVTSKNVVNFSNNKVGVPTGEVVRHNPIKPVPRIPDKIIHKPVNQGVSIRPSQPGQLRLPPPNQRPGFANTTRNDPYNNAGLDVPEANPSRTPGSPPSAQSPYGDSGRGHNSLVPTTVAPTPPVVHPTPPAAPAPPPAVHPPPLAVHPPPPPAVRPPPPAVHPPPPPVVHPPPPVAPTPPPVRTPPPSIGAFSPGSAQNIKTDSARGNQSIRRR